MMRTFCLVVGLTGSMATAAVTFDVSVKGTAGGVNAKTNRGETVSFEIRGILDSASDNEGLAAFSVVLSMTGPDEVNLGSAATVTEGDAVMDNFSRNEGYDNAFGGTPNGNDLVQIGGASNSIDNDPLADPFLPFPGDGGIVPLAVGHTEVVLAAGTVIMPMTIGTYTLSVSELLANVISDEELGPIYATEMAVAGATTSLTIDVLSCVGDLNGDDMIDPLDVGFVLSRFGCPVGTGDSNCDSADLNNDGVVDPLDVGFLLARFGDCPE